MLTPRDAHLLHALITDALLDGNLHGQSPAQRDRLTRAKELAARIHTPATPEQVTAPAPAATYGPRHYRLAVDLIAAIEATQRDTRDPEAARVRARRITARALAQLEAAVRDGHPLPLPDPEPAPADEPTTPAEELHP